MIQSHYHALIEALTRKLRTAPQLATLVNGQFVTQASSTTHLPYALFESLSARDLSLDGDSCIELTLQIHSSQTVRI